MEAETLAAHDDNITFVNQVPDGLMVAADKEQLYRVISNLIRNARQALQSASLEGAITVEATTALDSVQIRVSDTGPGLPAKAKENLFTAFQGGTRKGGSGLGLAISAELIRGHGGELCLERSDGSGTAFLITLPKV